MLNYLSSKPKQIDCAIKQEVSDFIVEEIMEDGTILECNKQIKRANNGSQFVHFVLQKENWSTTDATRKIASCLHISPKRINYAGTKDKRAITTQLMSAFGIKKESIVDLKISGMKILGAWNSKKKVELGTLLGNRFKIKISEKINEKKISEAFSELNGKFPNYFGPQRFGGTRENTHKIGEAVLRSELRSAVEMYLMDYTNETNAYAIEARKQLCEERDYKKALAYFPKHLKLERLMLLHLAKYPNDYGGALRKLPRQILLLFVHAFQSYIFNIMLSERLCEGESKIDKLKLEEGEYYCGEKFGFPDLEKKTVKNIDNKWIAGKIIGYQSELNERESGILERFNIRKTDFRIKALPEINSKGTYRTLLAPLKDFCFKEDVFRFSLPSGSYATSALREFVNLKPIRCE
ncbi:MAG: tRNA pseudouridine(13) synthase TruD [Candidatus Micrarchaeota archaeon]